MAAAVSAVIPPGLAARPLSIEPRVLAGCDRVRQLQDREGSGLIEAEPRGSAVRALFNATSNGDSARSHLPMPPTSCSSAISTSPRSRRSRLASIVAKRSDPMLRPMLLMGRSGDYLIQLVPLRGRNGAQIVVRLLECRPRGIS